MKLKTTAEERAMWRDRATSPTVRKLIDDLDTALAMVAELEAALESIRKRVDGAHGLPPSPRGTG